jgi:transporter family-2 protein
MNTTYFLALLAVVSGALIPAQAAANAALSRSIGGNVPFAAMMLFMVGVAATGLAVLASGKGLPQMDELREAPWWSYTGGLIVGFYVLIITFIAPRLGVGNAIALVVTGQVLAAVTIDHFGLMRSLTIHLSPTRLIGVVLMAVGVFLALKR